MFLTLVGWWRWACGGAGAGQAITAFLDRKRNDIAILKSVGASGGFVFLVFFLQVMRVAVAATLLGAALGAALPFAVVWIYGDALPVPPTFGLYPLPLLLALAFGLLSAVAFAVPPLSRARAVPPASLFRDVVSPANPARTEFLSRHFRCRRAGRRGSDSGAGALAHFRGAVSGGLGAWRCACCALLAEGLRRGIAATAASQIAAGAAGAGQSGAARRGDRRHHHRAGPGPDPARHRHAAERHHQHPGRQRAAAARRQFLFVDIQSADGPAFDQHHQQLLVRQPITSAPR